MVYRSPAAVWMRPLAMVLSWSTEAMLPPSDANAGIDSATNAITPSRTARRISVRGLFEQRVEIISRGTHFLSKIDSLCTYGVSVPPGHTSVMRRHTTMCGGSSASRSPLGYETQDEISFLPIADFGTRLHAEISSVK